MIVWGIVGCGDVTEFKSGPAFSKIANSTLHAVMRRNAAKAADYAARHHINKWYTDAMQLIHDPEVNAIYIATPPSSHEQYALAAIEAGKSIYVEKPFTMNAASARKISEAAKKRGVKLSVAHYRRQMPIFKKIKELIDTGAIGNTLSINLVFRQHGSDKLENNWRLDPSVSGGGYFHDLAPHQLDLIYYYFKAPVLINGISGNVAHNYKADDAVSCSMLFENGAIFSGSWMFSAPAYEQKDTVEIIGTEGSITFSVFDMRKVELRTNGDLQTLNFEPLQHVQQPMIEAVVDYFLGNVPNPCSGDDGYIVMEMIDTITRH